MRQAVLQAAIDRLGGLDSAAEAFKIDPRIITLYLEGEMPVPGDLFLRATDIVMEEPLIDTSRLL